MTKTGLLVVLALCAAPQLMIAADAQTARAPASAAANARTPRMPSAAEMAAQHKQICQDAYARTIGDLAYLEARLNPTSAQQPLFDRWKSVKMEIAKRDMADCATRETVFQGKPPTLLESMAGEQEALKRRLADLDAEIPVLGAFYNVLTQAQKDAWDHPGQGPMMMPRRRSFTGATGGNAGGLAVPPAYAAPAPAYGNTAPSAYGEPVNPAPASSQASAIPTPPPLKNNVGHGFFTSVFGGGNPVVAKAHVTGYGKDKDGHFRVTLADGEVWRISSSDDYEMPQWKAPASRYVVNIYEGALGSYNMEVGDDSRIYKVRRLN